MQPGTGNPAQRVLTNPCIYYGNSVVPNVRCCSKQLGCMSEQFATPSVSGCVWVVLQDRCFQAESPKEDICLLCSFDTDEREKKNGKTNFRPEHRTWTQRLKVKCTKHQFVLSFFLKFVFPFFLSP